MNTATMIQRQDSLYFFSINEHGGCNTGYLLRLSKGWYYRRTYGPALLDVGWSGPYPTKKG